MILSGKVCQLQQLPPPLFMPVKSAVTPPAGHCKPLPGEGVEAAMAVASIQTTPVNPKGMETDTQYYTLKVNTGF